MKLAALVVILSALLYGEVAGGFALIGELRHRNLKHFEYVNPNAPKGGIIKRHVVGSFDSFNPFGVKGTPASGIELIYDTLMVASENEPSSEYGLIAKGIEVAPDNSYVIFHLDKNARFHDGVPLEAKDVEFSFHTLTKQGSPLIRRYYEEVSGVEVLDAHRVKFTFANPNNRELPLILGQLQILPRHFYESRPFGERVLEIPLGSGAYRIVSFKPGKEVVYERVKDYWARSHPARLGYFNFDRVIYEYYQDDMVALEAFRAGAYDWREESSAKQWALGYEGEAKKAGAIKQARLEHQLPSGMQGFFFNTRRAVFQDIRVREALGLAFDFEWSNRHLFFNQYTRTKSYFDNSELAARAIPSGRERAILEPLASQLPSTLFSEPLPLEREESSLRARLVRAQGLLEAAGYEMRENRLIHTKTKEPLRFELLLVSPMMERVAIPLARNLARLGVEMNIRLVDVTQYLNRLRHFDYDMVVGVVGQSLSPGNEQRYFWHSSVKDERGSRNYAGIDNPVVDRLVEGLIAANDRATLVAYTRALDRVLLWGHYAIPQFHNRAFRVAHWDRFSYPENRPAYGLGFWTWWVDEAREESLLQAYPRLRRR